MQLETNEIVFTGGSGLLGTAMREILSDAKYPTRNELNVKFDTLDYLFKCRPKPKVIVHMAASTKTVEMEKSNQAALEAIETNIRGTASLVEYCMALNKRLIYISTDYVFRGDVGDYAEDDPVYPVNKYAWSKLGGECAAQMMHNSLIVRTSFGQDSFEHDKAFDDHYTSRMKVSEFAAALKELVFSDLTGVIHVGEGRKSVYDFAGAISPQKYVHPIKRSEIKGYVIPHDTSLNTERWKEWRDGLPNTQ